MLAILSQIVEGHMKIQYITQYYTSAINPSFLQYMFFCFVFCFVFFFFFHIFILLFTFFNQQLRLKVVFFQLSVSTTERNCIRYNTLNTTTDLNPLKVYNRVNRRFLRLALCSSGFNEKFINSLYHGNVSTVSFEILMQAQIVSLVGGLGKEIPLFHEYSFYSRNCYEE